MTVEFRQEMRAGQGDLSVTQLEVADGLFSVKINKQAGLAQRCIAVWKKLLMLNLMKARSCELSG